MKYFTDKKFQNGSAHQDYETYARSIWSDLTSDLKSIQGEMLPEDMFTETPYCLHDSLIFSHESNRDLKFIIGTNHQEEWVQIELTYKDGIIKKEVSKQRLTNKPTSPDNDIMCHEVTKEKYYFVHTILFASGEELEIQFSDLTIKQIC